MTIINIKSQHFVSTRGNTWPRPSTNTYSFSKSYTYFPGVPSLKTLRFPRRRGKKIRKSISFSSCIAIFSYLMKLLLTIANNHTATNRGISTIYLIVVSKKYNNTIILNERNNSRMQLINICARSHVFVCSTFRETNSNLLFRFESLINFTPLHTLPDHDTYFSLRNTVFLIIFVLSC